MTYLLIAIAPAKADLPPPDLRRARIGDFPGDGWRPRSDWKFFTILLENHLLMYLKYNDLIREKS